MHDGEPEEAPSETDEDDAIRRRFAELMHRFWRQSSQPEPTEEG